MRCLDLTEDASVTEEILHIISANSPNRIMCPQLRNLSWVVQPHTLPFYRLFLSPHLTTFSLKYRSHWGEIPDEVLSGITSVVLELDNLSLRHLYLTIPARISPSLDSAVSSAVLRCGPSLESLSAPTPLSDAAVQHVMRLPNLTTWEGVNGPAGVSDLSLSGAFPELKALQLQAEASLEWLPLFWAAARHTSSGQDSRAPFNHAPGQKLTVLECWADVSVDAAFMSPIMLFHGLIELMLESTCPSVGGCTFSLTDDDVAEIATALPRLRIALFGRPCSANSCRTTVSSLVFLSTHCKSLELLELHFNTTNLRDELESVSVDPRPNDLPSSPGRFFSLCMADAPYSMRDEDVVPMLTGFFRIFPSLGGIQGNGSGWYRLSPRFNPQVRSTLFSALREYYYANTLFSPTSKPLTTTNHRCYPAGPM